MSSDNIYSLIANPAFLSAFFLLLLILNIVLLMAFLRLKKKIILFLRGKNAENLEDSIKNLINDTDVLHLNLEKISQEQTNQKKMLSLTIKKIGIVRFNPFNNTGGDQSFAVALLNSDNCGITISSLFLREGTRIYAKPIKKLKSSYPLSKEEEDAIKKALESNK